MGTIKREEIPEHISSVLGTTNKDIINTIILDIINESINKPYIKMSEKVFKALFDLKKFNYEHIYNKTMTKEEKEYYKKGMNKLFSDYLSDVENNNQDSLIFKLFLNNQSTKYLEENSNKRKVIDFIAGMTHPLARNIRNCWN